MDCNEKFSVYRGFTILLDQYGYFTPVNRDGMRDIWFVCFSDEHVGTLAPIRLHCWSGEPQAGCTGLLPAGLAAHAARRLLAGWEGSVSLAWRTGEG